MKSEIIEENGPYYTFHHELIEILNKLGYKAKRKKFKSWSQMEGSAIVKINPSKSGKFWHWVVFYKGNIFDPKPKYKEPITDFRGRIGVGQYIEIF